MQVTTSNKKASTFNLQCAATGLFMADASSDFKVLAVTYRPQHAFQFPDDDAAEHAKKFVRSLYGSFDWRAVPAES